MKIDGSCGLGHDIYQISCYDTAKLKFGVCDCARTRGDDEGFTLNTKIDLWVHAPCGRPTEMTLKSGFSDEIARSVADE